MNVQNRTLFIKDNLDIMRGIDSECIDLIYLDPPFNTNKQYRAPIGSPAEGASFKDIWTDEDIKDEWHGQIAEEHEALYQIIQSAEITYDKSMKIYLMAMAIRLFEMKRLLKPTGSIYLHCDPTANAYLRMIMDALFGKKKFRNEIVWHYSGWNRRLKRSFSSRHDVILFYGNSTNHNFNSYAVDWESEEEYIQIRKQKVHIDDAGRKYVLSDGGGGTRVRRYLEEAMAYGKPVDDVWDIPKINNSSKEDTGYPTQKPLALLQRIIKASSNEGDVVLDPFCGCATACVAAEQLARQWIGIDISPDAEDITKLRLQEEVDNARLEPDNPNWFNPLTDVDVSRDPPVRTDPSPPRQLLLQDVFPRSLSEEYSQEQLQVFLSDKHRMYGNQEGKCNGCQYPLPFRNMTIDHINPQSIIADPNHPDHLQIPQSIIDNPDHPENLQLLCGACNSKKGDRSHQYLIDTLREEGILR